MDKFNDFMQLTYDTKMIELIFNSNGDLKIDISKFQPQTINVLLEPDDWLKLTYKATVQSPIAQKNNDYDNIWIFRSSWTRFKLDTATVHGNNVMKYIKLRNLNYTHVNDMYDVIKDIQITPDDNKYLTKCEKMALSNIRYKKKIAPEIKEIHKKLQTAYNMETSRIIDELIRKNEEIKVVNNFPIKLYPPIIYLSTVDEFRWTTAKYILLTCSPIICKDMFMKLDVYCHRNNYFNKCGINKNDMDVSFELDQSFLMNYLNEKNATYRVIDCPAYNILSSLH